MKHKSSLLFLPSLTLALLALASLPFPSTALSLRGTTNSHFQETTNAINSNLFHSRLQQSSVHPGYGRQSRTFFAAASASTLPFPSSKRDVETRLPGSFWASAKSKYLLDLDWAFEKGMGFWKRLFSALKFFFWGGLVNMIIATYGTYFRSIPISIYDARAKQAEEGLSKADFFDKYGFVLLNSTSAMTAEDWEASERDLSGVLKDYTSRSKDAGAKYNQRMHDFRNADTPVKKIFAEETKELVKSILPRAKTIMPPAKGI
jgi:hypothetical protein